MKAAAHSPKFAAKIGIPVGVAKDFVRADTKKTAKPFGKSRKS
jgi:hypothetical protein